jgi:serine/threonine-protein kinase PknG
VNCQQPGCGGQIVDGYCDMCGMAPASSAGAPGSGGSTPAPVSADRSQGSGRTPASGTSASSSRSRRPGSGRTRGSSSRLGGGLVEIPAVPYRDPSDAVMSNPVVAESRRFCSRCDQPVGRGKDGQPGRTAGFCRNCGASFSFDPKLQAGDLVARQYEVVGCLAHGGMGWVYLARDRNVSDRWVVLKGLLGSGDEDAMAAALAERRFLAEVEHPNIVKIFNFVQQDDAGYIVMEYVGGQSLKQILAGRRDATGGNPNPIPVAQAIAYMIEILPAFAYLHEQELLFCDFKLDNVIQTRHSLKLIDLGGVYQIGEESSAIFGTVGYQAPEIASAGPSIASDLFTVARTLAVMCFDFRGYQGNFRYTLPAPDAVPLFGRIDSLYRLLLKGTATNPDDRFQSAEDMADQLQGVLREVVAVDQGRPVPGLSKLFTGALRSGADQAGWRALPRPQVAREDPAAGYLAAITVTDPEQATAQLIAAPERTVEVSLALAAALIETGEWDEVESELAAIEAEDAWDWRVPWFRGVAELARRRGPAAQAQFTRVYHSLPGELAPKLALGVACELAGEQSAAAAWYDVVSRTDPAFTVASFGLARCRLTADDRAGALAAYERVPDSSSAYIDAQTARIRCLGSSGAGVEELLSAGSIVEALGVSAPQRTQLAAELLESALELVQGDSTAGERHGRLLGHPLSERELRSGLEGSYRALARQAANGAERVRLVDQANRVRPRTWI